MNRDILNSDIQNYIDFNIESDTLALLLKGIPFTHIDPKQIIRQIEAKKRCKAKLPTWFNTLNIYYPNKLNIEQTSSEITAKYKADLFSGKSIVDITGGFGVDSYYFSKQFDSVTHYEIDAELSEIVKHNFKSLGITNITCYAKNGIDAIQQSTITFDCIYADPSRRSDSKSKVFLLSDCTPNIKAAQHILLNYAKQIIVKTSPLLDITATRSELNNVKTIHCVAVNNEVKELLWVLEQNYSSSVTIKTVNLHNTDTQIFDFNSTEEATSQALYSKPLSYIYEPNLALLKAGAFNVLSTKLNIKKLHKHSHLYTSESVLKFPGRRFKVHTVVPFQKKKIAKLNIDKANITTRNFPLSVNAIRKRLKIKEGGSHYLFFTTDVANTKIVILCHKI